MLSEKYRPKRLEDVIGQDKAVATVRRFAERGELLARAYWLSGASGTGKTTLARILAGMVADDWLVREFDSGDALGTSDLDAVEDSMGLCAPGKGGRAFIVNEAHGIRRPILRRLLGILERIPRHVVFVFTTTRDGQEALFEDDIDAGPLLSRCTVIPLTNQGLASAFAERCQQIARAEGLDGRELSAYVRLAQDCKNNMRAMLGRIESGAMMAAKSEGRAAA